MSYPLILLTYLCSPLLIAKSGRGFRGGPQGVRKAKGERKGLEKLCYGTGSVPQVPYL